MKKKNQKLMMDNLREREREKRREEKRREGTCESGDPWCVFVNSPFFFCFTPSQFVPPSSLSLKVCLVGSEIGWMENNREKIVEKMGLCVVW